MISEELVSVSPNSSSDSKKGTELRSKARKSPRKQEASVKATGGLQDPQTCVGRDYRKKKRTGKAERRN